MNNLTIGRSLYNVTRSAPRIADNVSKSFATLSKYRKAGQFDQTAAIRLLGNNVRDAARYLRSNPPHAALAYATRLLLAEWASQP